MVSILPHFTCSSHNVTLTHLHLEEGSVFLSLETGWTFVTVWLNRMQGKWCCVTSEAWSLKVTWLPLGCWCTYLCLFLSLFMSWETCLWSLATMLWENQATWRNHMWMFKLTTPDRPLISSQYQLLNMWVNEPIDVSRSSLGGLPAKTPVLVEQTYIISIILWLDSSLTETSKKKIHD